MEYDMAASFNKGDISEGILAAAIASRFISKTQMVTEASVTKFISLLKVPAGGGSISKEFKSENAQPKILDTVVFSVGLAPKNMVAFLASATYREAAVKEIVRASVGYANSKYVRDWADMMYNNNQKNYIEIRAEGLLDQTGTKVDLKIVIDGKQAGVGISLKSGDVKQFGQVGGSSWDSMSALWSPLNIRFSDSIKKNYIEMISTKQLAPALSMIYGEAYNQLKKKPQPQLRELLAKYMNHHATLGEDNVLLVQLNRGNFKAYNFSELNEKLKTINIDVSLGSGVTDKLKDGGFSGGNSIPKLEFLADEEVLVQIRVKLEGNRVNSKGKTLPLTIRNYIEKGGATTNLLT